MLAIDHKMKADIIQRVKELMNQYYSIKDMMNQQISISGPYVKKCKTDYINMADGCTRIWIDVDESYYFDMLSEITGENIHNEYDLMKALEEMAKLKNEYSKVIHAVNAVRQKGYGVVSPEREDITLDRPEITKHGNKFGVKIHAQSPSIHMIKANIETEIAPIVGSEEQANDLIKFINDSSETENGIWDTNIFGKTVEQLIKDGITSKLTLIGEESQQKLQETMQKIVNDSNGGIVCIII